MTISIRFVDCGRDEIFCPFTEGSAKAKCFKQLERCDGDAKCKSRYDEQGCGECSAPNLSLKL